MNVQDNLENIAAVMVGYTGKNMDAKLVPTHF